MTLCNLTLFGEVKCLCKLVGREILKEIHFKYVNKCFLQLMRKVTTI